MKKSSLSAHRVVAVVDAPAILQQAPAQQPSLPGYNVTYPGLPNQQQTQPQQQSEQTTAYVDPDTVPGMENVQMPSQQQAMQMEQAANANRQLQGVNSQNDPYINILAYAKTKQQVIQRNQLMAQANAVLAKAFHALPFSGTAPTFYLNLDNKISLMPMQFQANRTDGLGGPGPGNTITASPLLISYLLWQNSPAYMQIRAVLIHEIAHLYQTPDTLADKKLREGGATAYAVEMEGKVWGSNYSSLGDAGASGYDTFLRYVQQNKGEDWILYNQFGENAPTTGRVLANIFDPIQQELDQSVYQGITPRPSIIKFIKEKFYETFENLVQDPEFYFSLVLTGSLTTYQYSDTSDCDISVIPDYLALSRKLHLPPGEIRRQCIRLGTKALDGVFVPGTQHPLQFFMIPPETNLAAMFHKGIRSGWSFRDEDWINPPEKNRVHNVSEELPDLYRRAAAIGDKMRILLDGHHYDEAKQLFALIHAKRNLDEHEGLGDFSEGNIVYKYLLHEGLFDRLKEIGVRIAGRHDFTWVSKPENWELTQDNFKGPSGWRPQIPQSVVDTYIARMQCIRCDHHLNQENGYIWCPYCGWEPQAKVSKTNPNRVVYNFNHDKIILANDDFDEHVMDSDQVILGSYDGENVNLDASSKQWLNANYFKRLWLTTYPHHSLSNVFINDEYIPTRNKDYMTYTEKNPAVVHNPEIFKHAKDKWREGKDWKDFIKNKGIKVEFQIGDTKDESFDGKVTDITKEHIIVEVAPGEVRTLSNELLKQLKFRVRDDK
jgi:DNA-directed RNA polymerase subunit RPC12/RpoP